MVPAGKTFVLHFDYIISDTRLVRVSISNIFKEFKVLSFRTSPMYIELEWELAADPSLRWRALQQMDSPLSECAPNPRGQPGVPPRLEGELLYALSPSHFECVDPRHLHL
jgi:hypothetical protein